MLKQPIPSASDSHGTALAPTYQSDEYKEATQLSVSSQHSGEGSAVTRRTPSVTGGSIPEPPAASEQVCPAESAQAGGVAGFAASADIQDIEPDQYVHTPCMRNCTPRCCHVHSLENSKAAEKRMQTWKAKDFVVMLTFDGLDKVDKSTKQLLSTGGGFFSEPLFDVQKLNGRQRPFVHMFQRTVRVKDGTDEFVKFVSLCHSLADAALNHLACLLPTSARCILSILPFSQPIRVIVCIKSKNAGRSSGN